MRDFFLDDAYSNLGYDKNNPYTPYLKNMGLYDEAEELALKLYLNDYADELFLLRLDEKFGAFDDFSDDDFEYPNTQDDKLDETLENYERSTEVYHSSVQIKITEEDWISLLEFMSED